MTVEPFPPKRGSKTALRVVEPAPTAFGAYVTVSPGIPALIHAYPVFTHDR